MLEFVVTVKRINDEPIDGGGHAHWQDERRLINLLTLIGKAAIFQTAFIDCYLGIAMNDCFHFLCFDFNFWQSFLSLIRFTIFQSCIFLINHIY